MGWGNPILGGIALMRAAIRSPGYVASSQGWTINQDGSAEFNNVTIRGGEVIDGSALFYNGTPALGNLDVSIVDANGTDTYGNDDFAGICSYQPAGTAVPSSVAQLDAGQLNMGTGFQFTGLGGASPAALTVSAAQGSGSSASLNSGQDSGSDSPAAITVNSADATGGGSAAGTVAVNVPLVLGDTSPPPVSNAQTAIYADSIGVPNTLASDGNVYRLGHRTVSASGITVNSTTLASVLGMPMKAGHGYHVTGMAIYHGNQAAGSPQFSWGGGGSGLVLGAQQNGWQSYVMSGGGTHVNNGALGAANGPTLLNGGEQVYTWDIYVNVTTGGTLFVTAAEVTSGDSWEIDEIYASYELF